MRNPSGMELTHGIRIGTCRRTYGLWIDHSAPPKPEDNKNIRIALDKGCRCA